jgi:SNF family Na+-dependent transporter
MVKKIISQVRILIRLSESGLRERPNWRSLICITIMFTISQYYSNLIAWKNIYIKHRKSIFDCTAHLRCAWDACNTVFFQTALPL